MNFLLLCISCQSQTQLLLYFSFCDTGMSMFVMQTCTELMPAALRSA